MNAVKNKYGVAPGQWGTWKAPARRVFNELYGAMADSPWAFWSSKVVKDARGARARKSTAWSAAWVAADIVNGDFHPPVASA